MSRIFLKFILVCLCATNLNAQESINSSGNSVQNSNSSISYSVGQVFYTMEGSVSSGVQQSYEIVEILSHVDDFHSVSCKIYPNPTTDIVNIELSNSDKRKLSYKLINETGAVVKEDDLQQEQFSIKLNEYNEGLYFLELILDNNAFKTYKIIKTQL